VQPAAGESVDNRWNQLAIGGIICQLITPFVNRFHRLPIVANLAAGSMPAARLSAVGNRGTRLATGEISWSPMESITN
jgi:hypothetical protein